MRRSTFEEIDELLGALNVCQDADAVIGLLSSHMQKLGFEKSAYWLRWPQVPDRPHVILSTYPKQYVERYQAQDFGAHDMVGLFATNTNRPFAWREIGKKYEITRKQRIIFHESSSVGIREGASVPIHGPNMTKATFSVSSDIPEKEFAELFSVHRHEIHLLATGAHERLMALGLGNLGHIQPLTERETEIILWISRGCTYGEIGERLAIQDDTVKKHMQSIFRKLGASNSPHAVAVAIVHGLIIP
jgi:LuxR family transcriptional regulator